MLKKFRYWSPLLWTLAASPALAQKGDFKPELDTIFKAFKTRQYEVIKPLLDPQVKIGELPQGLNDAIVPALLKQLPEPDSYVINEVKKDGNVIRVKTTYTYVGGRTASEEFVFNTAHKITSLGLPGKVKFQNASLNQATRVQPDKLEVPFELHNDLIYVTATLNGKKENFVLDSGAPALVLNADHIKPEALRGIGAVAGVGGQAPANVTHVDEFEWYGLKMSGFDVVATSLGHLEEQAETDFVGLIGYDVFKDYEVTFDYKRNRLTLVRADKPTPFTKKTPLLPTNVTVVPFEMRRHIPVFPMKIGDKTYQVGLDSGAGGNLLFAKYWPDVQANIAPATLEMPAEDNMAGVGKQGVQAKFAQIKDATVGTTQYTPMLFAFEDSTLLQLNTRYGLNIDGLLGYEFLRQYVTTVNYKKGELRIFPAIK